MKHLLVAALLALTTPALADVPITSLGKASSVASTDSLIVQQPGPHGTRTATVGQLSQALTSYFLGLGGGTLTGPLAVPSLTGDVSGTTVTPPDTGAPTTLANAISGRLLKSQSGALATLGVGSGLSSDGSTLSAALTSVAGRTGAVTLSTADIAGLGTLATQSAASAAITGGTITGADVSGATVTATGGTVARAAAARAADVIWAPDHGSCTWDATHDVGPCIQAALDYAASLPTGGAVHVPRGAFGLATPLTISKSNVSLQGEARGGLLRTNLSPTFVRYAVHLEWTGAAGATMLTVSPPTNTTSGEQIGGTNVTGIAFDCQNSAATGVAFASVRDSRIDVGVVAPTGTGALFDTAQIADSNSLQNDDIWLTVVNTTGTGAAVVWDASGNITNGQGNVSLNRFHSISLVTKNGDGLVIKHADNNIVDYFTDTVVAGGTGRALVLDGSSSTLAPVGAESNAFFKYSTNGATVAQGTDSGWTTPSKNNTIWSLDEANSTPDPTIGTGATINWRRTDAIWSAGTAYLQGDFGNTTTAIADLRALPQVDPLRVYASNSTGILLGARNGGSDLLARYYIDTTTGFATAAAVNGVTGFKFGGPSTPLISGGPLQLESLPFANLPTPATGRMVFCSNCLKPGETSGSGTGMVVFDDGHSHWISTAGTVAAS